MVTSALFLYGWEHGFHDGYCHAEVYYPNAKKLQLLLPLALEDKKRIDVALVCNHVYKPEEGVNNYEGRTIFTLQMAYNNARLITRPDSDWLMADMAINK